MTTQRDPQRGPGDPRAVLRDHRAVPSPNAERVEGLWWAQGAWLARRAARSAHHFRLDAEDLVQEVLLSLLRRTSSTVDETNSGLRTWLGVRIDRTAVDMWESPKWGARGRYDDAGPDELAAIEAAVVEEGRWLSQTGVEPALDVHLLVDRGGLTPHEAQTLAFRCADTGWTLREFAARAGRSHDGVRKELERVTRKAEHAFGLSADEDLVLRMLRRHGSPGAVARLLDHPLGDVRHLGDRAAKKITSFFDGPEGLL